MSDTPDATRPTKACVILVLDDDEAIRRAAKNILELYGYAVVIAGTAHEAVGLAEAQPVDLLLCDLVLPGLGGREAANMLLAHHPTMKVVYMSGFSSIASHRQQIEGSGDPFLAKPFEVPELLQIVEQTLST